jgi:ketosteroid isomerase-like protein
MRDRKDLIRAMFAAYRANDRKVAEEALAADFQFTSPFDDRIDKATYFARCWKSTDWVERHDLERTFVEGDQAFVTYNCVAKDGRSFRNTEFFVFTGDKIRSIDVYFGATYQHGLFAPQER